MRKKNLILIILFCCLFQRSSFSQQTTFVRDTVYVIIIRDENETKMPKVAYMLYKKLDSLPDITAIADKENALCSLFNRCIWFEEPFFTIGNYNNAYGFTNKLQQDSFFSELSKKIKNLNQQYSILFSKKFGIDTKLEFDCVKLKGDFWVVDKGTHEINNTDHSIEVKAGCYYRSYWYNLKDILKSKRLTKGELACIQQKIGQ
jgi:hypothetical protein